MGKNVSAVNSFTHLHVFTKKSENNGKLVTKWLVS